MALSQDVRNLLVRKWYMAELGRVPSADEQRFHSQVIADKGVDLAFAGIYDSSQAKAYRVKVGRTV